MFSSSFVRDCSFLKSVLIHFSYCESDPYLIAVGITNILATNCVVCRIGIIFFVFSKARACLLLPEKHYKKQ